MSERQPESLIPIAAAVSDGTPVDWEREKTRKPSLRAALEHLSVLERIRDLYRRPAGAHAAPARALAADDTRTVVEFAGSSAEPLFTWGTLRVLEKVGEGGLGEVFRAFEPSLETEVALKLLKVDASRDASAVECFISEARRLARVRHQNVLVVHGADRHGDRVGIWTEFLHGQSLEESLTRHGPMSAREATLIALDLCRALSAVHAAGLVHRDVKASNVMREEGGRIVLMDFGSVAEFSHSGLMDATRHIHGTPVTMAPEQLRGEVAGAATDVYGLGVLLYHLVSERYPLEAQTFAELVRRHEKRQYVPLRDRRADLPLEFVQVVERAMAPEPACRYASAGAMEHALAATLVQERPTWQEWLRTRWGFAAAAAVLLAVFIGLGSWIRGGNDANRDLSRPGVAAPGPATPRTPEGSTATPLAPGAPTPSEAIEATASLQRLVGPLEEPVPPGGKVAPGDQLSMQIEADERMHVYVLNEDSEGEVYVLFPVRGARPENPIEAHRAVRLPGTVADSLLYWSVTSAGGKESIIAIGTRTPFEEIERTLKRLPRAEPGRPIQFGRLSTETLRRLRGIGGLSTQPQSPGAAAHRLVDDMIRNLKERRAQKGDVWIWQTELENPAPGS